MSVSYVEVSFSFESTTTFTADVLCAFIPTIALCYYGKRSYENLKTNNYQVLIPASLLGHVLRLIVHIAAITLLFISIALYVTQLYSSDRMTLLFVPFLVFSSVSSLNWIVGFVLYTIEYRKLGEASEFLKRFWLISLIAQTAGILTTEFLMLFEHEFTALEVVHISYIVFLLTLVIHSVVERKNKAEEISTSTLPILYFPYKDIRSRASSLRPKSNLGIEDEYIMNSSHLINKFMSFSQRRNTRASTEMAPGANPVDHKIPSFSRINDSGVSSLQHLTRPLLDTSETNSSTSMDSSILMPKGISTSPKTEAILKSFTLFDEIYIQNYINIQKQDKSTIGYLIKYKKDGKKLETCRSYSEFFKLYQKTRKHHPNADLPLFPEKKTKNESSEVETLEQRKSQFTLLLKKISDDQLYTNYLDEFLRTDGLHPNSSSRLKTRIHQSQDHVEDAPSSQPILEEANETDNSCYNSLPRKVSCSSSLADLESALSSEHSSNNLQSSKFRLASPVPESIEETKDLLNSVPAQQLFHYSSLNSIIEEIVIAGHTNSKVGAWNDKRRGATATFYEFQIKNLSQEKIFATSKRYSNFKDLHYKLKDYAKKNKFSMPSDLPNRGTLGPLIRKTDPSLIEFRKSALPNYLQALLDHKSFQNCEILFEFLEIN